jgi:hypothetical protein
MKHNADHFRETPRPTTYSAPATAKSSNSASKQDALEEMSRKRKQEHDSRLYELEILSNFIRKVQTLTAEEKHRQMSIVYSRRKRVKQSQRIDYLTETCVSFRENNERLRNDNVQLESMIVSANSLIEQIQSSTARQQLPVPHQALVAQPTSYQPPHLTAILIADENYGNRDRSGIELQLRAWLAHRGLQQHCQVADQWHLQGNYEHGLSELAAIRPSSSWQSAALRRHSRLQLCQRDDSLLNFPLLVEDGRMMIHSQPHRILSIASTGLSSEATSLQRQFCTTSTDMNRLRNNLTIQFPVTASILRLRTALCQEQEQEGSPFPSACFEPMD